ncbi:MAG: hypothetical protein ACI9SJ_002250 [Flavobacteriaceae bacterium]|jgi:hypothetical protein|uniref:hypothetical protein n=1 Tax=Candidatus Marifrigoribacter sp. Uisw_064 TaxID=3230970 RepID=UPI003AE166EB
MNKNILIFSLLSIISFSEVKAQNGMQTRKNTVMFEHITRNNLNLDYLDVYEGTPYNNPNFLIGDIYINNENTAPNTSLRYNIYADEMEVKEYPNDEESDLKALTKSPDIYVTIINDKFVYIAKTEGIPEGGYFLELQKGKNVMLYKKLIKKYYPEKKAKTSFERDIPANFKDKPLYYIMSKDGKMNEVPSSKSKTIKMLSELNKGIKSYIKTNKIDITEEKGLIKAFRYCDTNML